MNKQTKRKSQELLESSETPIEIRRPTILTFENSTLVNNTQPNNHVVLTLYIPFKKKQERRIKSKGRSMINTTTHEDSKHQKVKPLSL